MTDRERPRPAESAAHDQNVPPGRKRGIHWRKTQGLQPKHFTHTLQELEKTAEKETVRERKPVDEFPASEASKRWQPAD